MTEKRDASIPATATTTSARSISSRRESNRQHLGRAADVGNERRGNAQIVERAARLLGHEGVHRARRHDADRSLDARHRLADGEEQCGRPGVILGAARQGTRREVLPALRRQARDEHVVGAGELPADLRDLLGGLALRQHDLRETDAAQAVEIERVVRTEHLETDHIRAGRLKLS